ncbi:isocitrate lyase/PEP mutase family protein [Aspergillus tanneri]|uniref:Carboxyvinyl-carboxyphosphonate phosphorylmutase n=1 Tax=Aspergillus tanneri TaxID=1220188 RepID=A0A5M9M6U1_9EURO|nr:uncharacterized protein ATNIH1004_011463 [Aspergillus tanneri]KAA8642518.1 hypothetical protein ATNIH1004_011463 [Aspergillus tanneri]
MSKSIANTTPYPFTFASNVPIITSNDATKTISVPITNCRGRIPSFKTSQLRSMVLEAHNDPSKIVAHVCSYDALSSKLCEEAGFPVVFLSGFAMSSALGLPDTGEAYARWQAAVDARNEGLDIWIMARTDSLIHGYEEALARARKAIELGVDCVFVEALPDRASMLRLRRELEFPVFANIIEGGKTENLSAKDLAEMGYSVVAYPFTLVAARLKSIREALEAIKDSFMVGSPPTVLSYEEVCEGVGFNRYYEMEEKYQYDESTTGSHGHQWD